MHHTLPRGVLRWKRMRGQYVSTPSSCRRLAAAMCSHLGLVWTQYQAGSLMLAQCFAETTRRATTCARPAAYLIRTSIRNGAAGEENWATYTFPAASTVSPCG